MVGKKKTKNQIIFMATKTVDVFNVTKTYMECSSLTGMQM